jgi:hypothetical protein
MSLPRSYPYEELEKNRVFYVKLEELDKRTIRTLHHLRKQDRNHPRGFTNCPGLFGHYTFLTQQVARTLCIFTDSELI